MWVFLVLNECKLLAMIFNCDLGCFYSLGVHHTIVSCALSWKGQGILICRLESILWLKWLPSSHWMLLNILLSIFLLKKIYIYAQIFLWKYICLLCWTWMSVPQRAWSFVDGGLVSLPAPLSSQNLAAGLAAPAQLLFTSEFH